MELSDRIRAYLAKLISLGELEYPRRAAADPQDSHAQVFKVACILLHGFDLSDGETESFLREFCANSDAPWTDQEIWHKIESAKRKSSDRGPGYLLKGKPKVAVDTTKSGPAPAPKREVKRADWAKIDEAAVESFTAGLPTIDTDWFRRRSPVDVATVTSGGFLDALYGEDERVIIFTRYYSQGDFIWRARHDGKAAAAAGSGWRLSDEQETRAARSDLPKTGKLGVWYLVQPISGRWEIGERVKDGAVKMTRRSEVNVTRWVHFVLESDELEAEVWGKVVASLKLPICAIYTSGGRSVHALVRYEVPSKGHWDQLKQQIERVVCPLGADPGALSAVRLSRLPGCLREGKEEEFVREDGSKGKRYVRFPKPRLQELLYLNPAPTFESIYARPEVRE